MEESLKFADQTRAIIGCAMKVHSYLGNGFHEVIYQKALSIELANAGLRNKREVTRKIMYDGECVGNKRLDIIVEDLVLVETKAIPFLDKICFQKVINYLKVFDLEVGLLLNFGSASLQYKRFVRSKICEIPPNP